VGEPLSTITIAKLRMHFWFLARLLGAYIVPGVLALGIVAAFLSPHGEPGMLHDVESRQALSQPFWRAARVFLFVAALLLLGTGLTPLVDHYLIRLPAAALFWANTISAIVDNATLAAAEIGPSLSRNQITAILLGLLISGGMLIPGNIPNIIAANRLRISSREWGRFGIPVGLVLLVVYFAVWFTLQYKRLF
jgi:predicted cation transporter